MTRVVHTGDTHLGYQQYHSPTRRQDFLDAFRQVVDDAIAEEVSAVVHAGDLFHDRRPALPDLLGTLSVLRRLSEAGIPFLAVVGNHESTRGGQWLDLFERLGLATRLGSAPEVVDDVAFYGLDHVPPSKRDGLDYAFDPHEAASAVLVAHGLFTPFAHADWETEAVLAEATVDFDAVLLGDNHAPGVERVDGTPVTYCGSTERVSAAERDGRGYNLVSFEGAVDIRRRAVETRPFVFVEVALAESEGARRSASTTSRTPSSSSRSRATATPSRRRASRNSRPSRGRSSRASPTAGSSSPRRTRRRASTSPTPTRRSASEWPNWGSRRRRSTSTTRSGERSRTRTSATR
jgi:DNA repair exonuclease SbcCD nuclease subunit